MKMYQIEQQNTEGEKKQYDIIISDGGDFRTEKRPVRKKKIKPAAWNYLGLIGQLGFSIAIPIAGGAFLGNLLDNKWSSYPKATLVFLLLGILMSFIGFIKTVQEIINKSRL